MEDSGFQGFGVPQTGHVDSIKGFIRPVNPVQPQEQTVFDDPRQPQIYQVEAVDPEKVEAARKAQEFKAYVELAAKASRTKFATGDLERDIYNYNKIRNISKDLTDMLDDG